MSIHGSLGLRVRWEWLNKSRRKAPFTGELGRLVQTTLKKSLFPFDVFNNSNTPPVSTDISRSSLIF